MERIGRYPQGRRVAGEGDRDEPDPARRTTLQKTRAFLGNDVAKNAVAAAGIAVAADKGLKLHRSITKRDKRIRNLENDLGEARLERNKCGDEYFACSKESNEYSYKKIKFENAKDEVKILKKQIKENQEKPIGLWKMTQAVAGATLAAYALLDKYVPNDEGVAPPRPERSGVDSGIRPIRPRGANRPPEPGIDDASISESEEDANRPGWPGISAAALGMYQGKDRRRALTPPRAPSRNGRTDRA